MGVESELDEEIRELHEVFEAWLSGADGASLRRAENALAAGFRLVSPGGELLEREPLLAGLQGARASRGSGFRIEVRAVTSQVLDSDGLVLATYEEWQGQAGEELVGRLSSALLRRRRAGGFAWLHVHETWLPETKVT